MKTVAEEIAELRRMTVPELKERYRGLHGRGVRVRGTSRARPAAPPDLEPETKNSAGPKDVAQVRAGSMLFCVRPGLGRHGEDHQVTLGNDETRGIGTGDDSMSGKSPGF